MSSLGWEKAPARLALGYTSRSSVLIKAPVFGGRGGGGIWGVLGALGCWPPPTRRVRPPSQPRWELGRRRPGGLRPWGLQTSWALR